LGIFEPLALQLGYGNSACVSTYGLQGRTSRQPLFAFARRGAPTLQLRRRASAAVSGAAEEKKWKWRWGLEVQPALMVQPASIIRLWSSGLRRGIVGIAIAIDNDDDIIEEGSP